MTRQRAHMSGRRTGPHLRSVQGFAGTAFMPRIVGIAFSMIVYRNAAPTGRERSRAGR